MSQDWSNADLSQDQSNDIASGDQFGASVYLNAAGDLAAFGAPAENSQGAVYIFNRTGSNSWSQRDKVVPDTRVNNASFGTAVAMSGDGNTLVVSAPFENGTNNGNTESGNLYVFQYAQGSWTQVAVLDQANGAANDNMGNGKIDISDDGRVIVAGTEARTSGQGAVSVWVDTSVGGDWSSSQEKELSPTALGSNHNFGNRVAIDSGGTKIAVGAYNSAEGGSNRGAVFVYEVSNRADWYAIEPELIGHDDYTKLTASDKANNDKFGEGLAMTADGNTVVVGAPGGEAVYIYTYDGDNWTEDSNILTATSPDSGEMFGADVDVDDDANNIVVGAPLNGVNDTGRTIVFTKSGADWSSPTQVAFTGTGATNNENMGTHVALNANSGEYMSTSNYRSGGGEGDIYYAALPGEGGGGGDPHIVPVFGSQYKLPDTEKTYLLFDNHSETYRVIIKGKSKVHGKGSFFRYIKIEAPDQTYIVDCLTPDMKLCTFDSQQALEQGKLSWISDQFFRRTQSYQVPWKKGSNRMGNGISFQFPKAELKVEVVGFSRNNSMVRLRAPMKLLKESSGALIRQQVTEVEF